MLSDVVLERRGEGRWYMLQKCNDWGQNISPRNCWIYVYAYRRTMSSDIR